MIRIIREFEAPPERVFRAYVDPELFAQWCGPRSIDTTIDVWDARTGGEWRYTASRAADDFAMGFWGSFHEVRPAERIVQTWAFDGEPDGVSLETVDVRGARGRPLPGRSARRWWSRSRSATRSCASGMDVGVREGYEKLDELLEGEP